LKHLAPIACECLVAIATAVTGVIVKAIIDENNKNK
jgi:hypothetical protein